MIILSTVMVFSVRVRMKGMGDKTIKGVRDETVQKEKNDQLLAIQEEESNDVW